MVHEVASMDRPAGRAGLALHAETVPATVGVLGAMVALIVKTNGDPEYDSDVGRESATSVPRLCKSNTIPLSPTSSCPGAGGGVQATNAQRANRIRIFT